MSGDPSVAPRFSAGTSPLARSAFKRRGRDATRVGRTDPALKHGATFGSPLRGCNRDTSMEKGLEVPVSFVTLTTPDG